MWSILHVIVVLCWLLGDSVDGDSLTGQLEIRSYSDDELLNSRRSSLHPVSTNVSLTGVW